MNRILLLALAAAAYWAWRRYQAGLTTPVSRAEAARLLDVPIDADAATVIAAHKRLISRVHPDTGGSAELASRVNQARDALLRDRP